MQLSVSYKKLEGKQEENRAVSNGERKQRYTEGGINVKNIGNSFIDAEDIIKHKQSNLKVS